MAYGTKYRIEWNSRVGPCRVDLRQEGYSSTITSLQAADEPLTITWGEGGQEGVPDALLVSDAELNVVGTSTAEQLEEVFDAPDREWKLRFEVDRGSGLAVEWEGFLVTDLWSDNPFQEGEAITLEAIDGLALLEGVEAKRPSTGGDATDHEIAVALARILQGELHSLPIRSSMDWSPYEGGDATSSDSPFDFLELQDKAYKELDEAGEPTGEIKNAQVQLRDIAQRFGSQVYLSGGEWHVRQASQVGDGTALKRYTLAPADDYFGGSGTADITTSLPPIRDKKKPRGRSARLQSVESVQQFGSISDLVQNGGFDDGTTDGWSVNVGGSSLSSDLKVKDYDNTPLGRNSTQSNPYVVKLTHNADAGPTNPDLSHEHLSQEVPAILHYAGPRGGYVFRLDFAQSENPHGVLLIPEIEKDDGTTYQVGEESRSVVEAANEARDGELFIEPLPGSNKNLVIPQGTKLRVVQTGPELVAHITLTEPALAGDTVLHGDISSDVPFDNGKDQFVEFNMWKTDGGVGGFTPTDLPDFSDENYRIETQEWRVPQVTPNGDRVVGDLSLTIGTTTNVTTQVEIFIDKIEAEILVGEESTERSSFQSADPGQVGDNVKLKHRVGDGPTSTHPRRLSTDSRELLGGWKRGPYSSGESSTDTRLEELLAEAWMARKRDTLDRRFHECIVRDGDTLLPHHVLNRNSKTYRVSHLSRTYGSGNSSTATVELTELKDAGTSGLTRAFAMEGPESAGGESGSVFIGSQTIDGASSWDDLTGKPSGLLSRNGDTDGISETVLPSSADITGALDLSNSPFLEIDTGPSPDALAVRALDEDDLASDSDTHVATQQSIKAYVDQNAVVEVDLGDDGTANINPLEQISVTGDPNGIFSAGDETGEFAISVGVKWPNANNVDGFDASELVQIQNQQTVTGQKTFSSEILANGGLQSGDDLMPNQGYSHSIGSSVDKWLTLDVAELRVSTLVAEKELATVGGRQLIGTANELASAVATGDTTVEVKYNNLANGDILRFEGGGKVEFMEVTSSASGTGPYTYDVTRDLDGTGANAWDQGDGLFSTSTGEGFIDLYAEHSFTDAAQSTISGPTIEFVERVSSDPQGDGNEYNNVSTRAAVGNLRDTFGYTSEIYGLAAGDPSGEQITATKNGVAVDGTLTAQAGGVEKKWVVGNSIYMWDSSASPSTINDDEIRISSNGTGAGDTNYVRLYQDPSSTDTWGIQGVSGSSQVFHLGEKSGASDNEIAGWNFDPSRLYKDLSGSNILLGIGEGSAFADVFDPRDGFFAIDTNTGALAGLGGKDNSDTVGVLVDNGNGDGSNGSYISMGNDHFRSSFGVTVFADGKTRMEVSASESYLEDLELRNLDVTGTITVGDGNGNGKLTDPTGAYTLDEDGLTFSDDQVIASEVTWDDAGTEVGSITAFSFGSEYWTRIKAGDEIRLNANGGDVKLSVDAALDGLSFVSVRTNKLTASDLDKGDAVIYAYQGSNFGIHLRAAVKEASGSSPNFTDTAIAVAA